MKEETARMKKCVAKTPLGRGSQPFFRLFFFLVVWLMVEMGKTCMCRGSYSLFFFIVFCEDWYMWIEGISKCVEWWRVSCCSRLFSCAC